MIEIIPCIYKAYIEQGNVGVEYLANLKEKALLNKDEEMDKLIKQIENLIFCDKGDIKDMKNEIQNSSVSDEIKKDLLDIIFLIS